jgi:hypothetical protein
MADYQVGKWTRANVVAFSLLGACATEIQETNEPVIAGDEGGSAGMAGSGGSLGQAGKGSSGAGGSGTPPGGSSSGRGGADGSGGAAAGAAQAGGGAGGAGGKANGGAGGKASGGAAGMSGGGVAGTGGAAPNPCATTELAIDGGAASSVELDTLAAANAWDGNTDTRWASEKTEPHWIYVDLGELAHVSRVRLTWEAAYATNYRIERANSANGPWTLMQTIANGNGGIDDLTMLTAGNGRYIRMFGVTRATAYGFSLYEIEVFGDLDETCK